MQQINDELERIWMEEVWPERVTIQAFSWKNEEIHEILKSG
jgi:hypothetical protein